jgi:hypothetical protein
LKKQYQIEQQRAVQQFRRIATEHNPNIQMILPLADVIGLLQQGVGNLLRETGLALMQTVMEEEVRHLAGERHQQHEARRAHRWGNEKGYCVVECPTQQYAYASLGDKARARWRQRSADR